MCIPIQIINLISLTCQPIVDEATAADFYSRLLTESPDALHYEFIEHAYKDELEHSTQFGVLYNTL